MKENFQFWVRAISISMASHLNYVVDWFPSLLVPFHLQRMKKRRRERISRRKLILKREKGQRRDLTCILVRTLIRNLFKTYKEKLSIFSFSTIDPDIRLWWGNWYISRFKCKRLWNKASKEVRTSVIWKSIS